MTYLENLRYYQKEAVENIYEFFKSDKCKAKMYISTGLGKTLIIAVAIQTILKNNNASILILSSRSMLCKQIKAAVFQMIEYVNIATHVRELKEQKILIILAICLLIVAFTAECSSCMYVNFVK